MVKGLYTAYSGMMNQQKRLDIISNNLANSATVGFKKESVTSQAFEDVLAVKIRDGSEAYVNKPIGNMSLGVRIGEVYTNYGQGSMRQTENPFDLAIEGDGFFRISMVDREGNETTRYTRNGCFTMNQEGYVVDEDGNSLLGSAGPIQVPTESAQFVIDKAGGLYADGQLVDTIELADFENYDYLKKYGDNMYEAVDGAAPRESSGSIHQGYTEQSNINVVAEMVEMISITRAFEANQKLIQTTDASLEKSVNQIGRV